MNHTFQRLLGHSEPHRRRVNGVKPVWFVYRSYGAGSPLRTTSSRLQTKLRTSLNSLEPVPARYQHSCRPLQFEVGTHAFPKTNLREFSASLPKFTQRLSSFPRNTTRPNRLVLYWSGIQRFANCCKIVFQLIDCLHNHWEFWACYIHSMVVQRSPYSTDYMANS